MMQEIRDILEASQNGKKGIILYFKGQNIGGMVVHISDEAVEIRSREYSRIVVRIEAIDGVAMS